jgi:dihydroxyacetone kinase-like protein
MLDPRSSRRKQGLDKRFVEGRASVAAPEARTYSRPTVIAAGTATGTNLGTATPSAIDAVAVRAALARCRVVVERHATALTRLDAVLGDGDHGDNLVIGFRAVDAALAEAPADLPPGELLRIVGHRLASAVGGASGPLYGTAVLEAGVRAGDAPTISIEALPELVGVAAGGLARRGRCAPGDKTILDALAPAADALAQGATWGAAVRAAAAGMRATRPMVARRGLALRLGPRSVGHLDPGAVSCVLLLRALGGR